MRETKTLKLRRMITTDMWHHKNSTKRIVYRKNRDKILQSYGDYHYVVRIQMLDTRNKRCEANRNIEAVISEVRQRDVIRKIKLEMQLNETSWVNNQWRKLRRTTREVENPCRKSGLVRIRKLAMDYWSERRTENEMVKPQRTRRPKPGRTRQQKN